MVKKKVEIDQSDKAHVKILAQSPTDNHKHNNKTIKMLYSALIKTAGPNPGWAMTTGLALPGDFKESSLGNVELLLDMKLEKLPYSTQLILSPIS